MRPQRNEVTKQIKKALKDRTGLAWSVTGGRGTGWGWLTIEAPKARRVMHDNNPDYTFALSTDQDELPWIERQPKEDEIAYYTSQEDREILAEVLGIEMTLSSSQGISISPNSWDFWLDRAKNGKPEPKPVEELKPKEITELPEAPQDVAIESIADGTLIDIKLPRLNKQSHIEEYLSQLDNEDNYHATKAKITHIAILSTIEYDNLANGNLLTDLEWLSGKGETGSTADLRDVDYFSEYTEEEQKKWRKGSYIYAVKVRAPCRKNLYINPQNYSYARYVGFDATLQQQENTEPIEESQPTDNVIVNMAKTLLETKSLGDVINILIGSGLNSTEALQIMTQVAS